MVDLYMRSSMERGLRLKESLEGSLPGLKVSGPVLEGKASPEDQRRIQEMAWLKEPRGPWPGRYEKPGDVDGVLLQILRGK